MAVKTFSHPVRTAARLGLTAAAIALALVGCRRGPAQPIQVFTFNYSIVPLPRGDDLLRRLPGNRDLIGDEFARLRDGPCNFSADFSPNSGRPVPRLRVGGNANIPVFSLTVSSTNANNINTTQPTGCDSVGDVVISIGSSAQPLPVGSSTSVGNASITLLSGGNPPVSTPSGTSQFFKGTLQAFDTSTRRTTAQFEFANRLPGNSGVLVGQGSFAMNP